MSEWVSEQTDRLQRLASVWDSIELQSQTTARDVIAGWCEDVEELAALEDALRSQGRWISGPADLMGVLEVAFDEVRHCRVLRWLLDPSGGHGMGQRFLREFATDIGRRTSVAMEVDALEGVVVGVEEAKDGTRADVVLRTNSWALLVEAKIFAGEQPNQGVRLESLWAQEEPVLVFLTKSGRGMQTGTDRWINYRWRDVAACLRRSLEGAEATGFGTVREYLKTLEAYFR